MKRYIIEWTMTGTLIVEANSPQEAQDTFDKIFTAQVHPNGEWDIDNDPPYEED